MKINKIKIGFIGQGWIGKNYADDFEKRGFDVVRYSQEEPYVKNKQEALNTKYHCSNHSDGQAFPDNTYKG